MIAWEHPFSQALYHQPQGSYQLANGLFAQADGGLLGVGFDQSLIGLVPVADSDSIYAVITDEVGLVGTSNGPDPGAQTAGRGRVGDLVQARARSSTSPGAQVSPSTPARTASARAPAVVTTTGTP